MYWQYLDLRWYPRPILRSSAPLWIRWLPARSQLPFPRRLRWPWQAVPRNHLPSPRIQDQVPRKFLRPPWEPRVRIHQPNLWFLWWMQTEVQHQALEDIHRLLQLLAYCRHHRWEDLYHARWSESRLELDGTDSPCYASYWCKSLPLWRISPCNIIPHLSCS